MKKTILITLTLFITTSLFSQSSFFIGKDSQLLIGSKVTVKEDEGFYSGFYKDKKINKKLYFNTDIGTNPSKIVGIEFTVIDTISNPRKYAGEKNVLILNSTKTGTIYYAYNPKYSDLFLLNILNLEIPEGFYCKRIEVEKDKFSTKTTSRTPTKYEFTITKVEENKEERIYLRLQAYGTTLGVNKTGVKILFADGSTLLKPESKIKYKNLKGTKGWTYSSFIQLNKEDINILTSKTITDYSLYIYERTMKESDSNELKEYLKCLTK